MKTIFPLHLSRQKGLSLIGLMIGLLISVLCILGSLTLYKNLIQVATESKLDSNHDGQLASAMLVIQLGVQNAGFGIEPDTTTPSIVINNPATGKTQLLWRFLKDGTIDEYECRGLHEEEDTTNGVFRVLKVIKVVDDTCDESTPLESFTWDTDNPVTVLGRWRVLEDDAAGVGLDDYITTNGTMFNFALSPSPVMCNPYGANSTADDLHAFLTVSVPGSVFLQGLNATDITRASKYEYCLTNIHYPATP
jgi:hypothetical protein